MNMSLCVHIHVKIGSHTYDVHIHMEVTGQCHTALVICHLVIFILIIFIHSFI